MPFKRSDPVNVPMHCGKWYDRSPAMSQPMRPTMWTHRLPHVGSLAKYGGDGHGDMPNVFSKKTLAKRGFSIFLVFLPWLEFLWIGIWPRYEFTWSWLDLRCKHNMTSATLVSDHPWPSHFWTYSLGNAMNIYRKPMVLPQKNDLMWVKHITIIIHPPRHHKQVL